MKNLACALAVATGLAMLTGQAFGQDAAAPATGAAAANCPAADAAASAGEGGTISASGGSGSDVHNLKVFACNGIRVGTAISSTSTADGTVLTVMPDANFLNGVSTFQVTAKGATTAEGEIRLAMTDAALRAQISAQ
jgi:hypothetical protein